MAPLTSAQVAALSAISTVAMVAFVISLDSMLEPNLDTSLERALSATFPGVSMVASLVSTMAAEALMSALTITAEAIAVVPSLAMDKIKECLDKLKYVDLLQ